MSVSNVIRAVVAVRGVRRSVLAAGCGITEKALRAKLNRGSWSSGDLIRAAAALGLRLAFVDDSGRAVVSFSPADAEPVRRMGRFNGAAAAAAPASDPSAGVGEE